MHNTISAVKTARRSPLESPRVWDRGDWLEPEYEDEVAEVYSTSLLMRNLCEMHKLFHPT